MSMEQSFLPEGPSANRTEDRWTIEPRPGEAWGIRRQAAGIIAMVLADSAPEQARARDHLVKCVDANPGRPEIALAQHLSGLRLAAAEGLPIDQLPPGQDADGAETPGQPALRLVKQVPLRPEARRPILHHHPTLKQRYGRADPRGWGGRAGDDS